jgi:hypothetical protein
VSAGGREATFSKMRRERQLFEEADGEKKCFRGNALGCLEWPEKLPFKPFAV